jgi:hypothetical protein
MTGDNTSAAQVANLPGGFAENRAEAKEEEESQQ